MTAIADAHIEAQARLRAVTAATVAAVWAALPTYDEDQVPLFTSTAAGVVLAAQRQAILLTTGFLARSVREAPAPIDPETILAAVRPGVPVEEVYRRPFVTVWSGLSEGRDWAESVKSGQDRAKSTAATDVQLAMRQTLVDVAAVTGRIVGYARVPDPGACKFCLLVAGQRYRTDQLMPIHPYCGCGVDVITEANRGDFAGDTANDIDLPAGVAVHAHGELGPVLTDSAHSFTSL